VIDEDGSYVHSFLIPRHLRAENKGYWKNEYRALRAAEKHRQIKNPVPDFSEPSVFKRWQKINQASPFEPIDGMHVLDNIRATGGIDILRKNPGHPLPLATVTLSQTSMDVPVERWSYEGKDYLLLNVGGRIKRGNQSAIDQAYAKSQADGPRSVTLTTDGRRAAQDRFLAMARWRVLESLLSVDGNIHRMTCFYNEQG
jgi:hypothetical protein